MCYLVCVIVLNNNHNLDTSEDFYTDIISTCAYEDRLDTIEDLRLINIAVCSGGIIETGEKLEDRARLLVALSSLNPQP